MIRDDAIVAALAAGLSQREAAERGGASLSSVERRMKDPAFRALVVEARGTRTFELQRVYTALKTARHAFEFVEDLYDDEEMFDTTAGEAIRHLKSAVEWLDEWAYLLEEELAS